MPCYDYDERSEGGPDAYDSGYTAGLADSTHNSPVAQMLCTMCRIAEEKGRVLPKEVLTWWNEHKLRDRKKAEARERLKKDQQTRKDALSKLTLAERRILGLK